MLKRILSAEPLIIFELLSLIATGTGPSQLPSGLFSTQMRNFVSKCVIKDPKLRAGFQELLVIIYVERIKIDCCLLFISL